MLSAPNGHELAPSLAHDPSRSAMKYSALSLVAAGIVLSGCESTVSTTSQVYSPTNPDAVQVLAQAPGRPFDVLGKVKDSVVYVPLNERGLSIDRAIDVISELRKKAAALGAEAVIVTDRRVVSPPIPLGGDSKDNVVTQREEAIGLAIRYKEAAQIPVGEAAPGAAAPAAAPATP